MAGAGSGVLADSAMQGVDILGGNQSAWNWSRTVAAGASGAFSAAMMRACFAAGTPLMCSLTESKPIDEFQVGDMILSRSEFDAGGPLAVKEVQEVFVRVAAILELRVNGQCIKTTGEHPFYVENKGWLPASELNAGNVLLSHDSQCMTIQEVTATGDYATVYNLRIADYHTYFVGSSDWGFSVWAHNAGTEYGGRARRDAKRAMAAEDALLDAHDAEFYGGSGVIYRLPGRGTSSGKPYIGSADDFGQRAATAMDGRDRSLAQIVGRYPIGNMPLRRRAEQAAMDMEGGIASLDNRRNEIRRGS
jgi:hypothetical protein